MHYRFVIVGLCFLLGLVNYLDRAIISFAVEPIKQEFGLDNTGFGLIISSFALGTASINAFAGWLLDRHSVHVTWTVPTIQFALIYFVKMPVQQPA